MDNPHPLDEWDQNIKDESARVRKQALLESSLVYQVFDTEPGKKLIEKWKQTLIDVPSANGESTLLQVGLAEGEKRFVRDIINCIKIHEEKQ